MLNKCHLTTPSLLTIVTKVFCHLLYFLEIQTEDNYVLAVLRKYIPAQLLSHFIAIMHMYRDY